MDCTEKTTTSFCDHITKAKEAVSRNQYATSEAIDVEKIANKIVDEMLEESLRKESSDGEVTVFLLPDNNIVVPLLDIFLSMYGEEWVHVRNLDCYLEICRKKVKSKRHTLVEKGVPICVHSMLARICSENKQQDLEPHSKPQHKIDHYLTVKTIMSKIQAKFPESFKILREGDFVKKSRTFVDSLLLFPEKLRQVLENVQSNCEFCGDLLKDWNHKELPINAFLFKQFLQIQHQY